MSNRIATPLPGTTTTATSGDHERMESQHSGGNPMFRMMAVLMRLLALFNAAGKGPAGIARYGVRRAAHRGLRRGMRKFRL
ncbi:MAG: hypothetical protein OXU19_09700, partial [bacterium]|nr:hypothetical protein [bacterium]